MIYILFFLLLITVLYQIARLTELLSEINKEEPNKVTEADNNTQGILYFIVFIVFIAFVVWQMVEWNHLLLPSASSVHGEIIDGLMSFSMNLILVVFFILTPLLGYFLFKYRGKDKKFAYFFPDNHKLELIWTIIPTIVLTGVIIYGLKTWDKAMNPDISNSKIIEVYAKQFSWTARYSGDDNILGNANFQLVKGPNQLGVDLSDTASLDDIMTREIHLVVDEPVLLKFRSQDVIHSAFLPHFRVQMNCVPGMITQFGFTPTKTTKQMKEDYGADFEYVLLCNKICGSAHYNMQMKFVVETQEEYNNWIRTKSTLNNTLTLK